MECPFCQVDYERIFAENDYAYAMRDKHPVSEGHSMVISNRHFEDIFDATEEELIGFWKLILEVKEIIDKEFSPNAYNIGANVGRSAGQTVMHMHVHIIPRYRGDVDDPTGGVRYVIPKKGNYKRPGYVPRLKKKTKKSK